MKTISILLLLVILWGCNNSSHTQSRLPEQSIVKNDPVQKTNRYFGDELIIPKDLNTFSRDSSNTYWIPKDTITLQGNFLKYYISNDSCCFNNIYLNWGNDTVNRIEIAQSVRQFRTYFTPFLAHQTIDYLILEHGCATDCWALLFLPLNNFETTHSILNVVRYNPDNYVVICGISDYMNINDHEFIEAVNIKTGRRQRIIFKNIAKAASPLYQIDSCLITDNDIYVRAILYDKKNKKDTVEVVRLKNEISK
jgi:hypothetical protein